jgi:cytochrome P450
METNPPSKSCPFGFDQHSDEHAKRWPEIYGAMRESNPRAWTESYGGFWIASRYDDIVRIAQNTENISAHRHIDPETGEESGGITIPPLPGVRGVPSETDSPEWDMARGFLNRWFSPSAVKNRKARIQQISAALLDNVIERGEIDFVEDFTSPLPGIVTIEIFGFPFEEWRTYSEPVHRLVYLSQDDPGFAKAAEGIAAFRRRVDEEIAARRAKDEGECPDDFLTYLAHGKLDGAPLTHANIQEMSWQILSGGVDTTTAVTSNALLYLGRHPDKRQELINNLEILPRACEEFVRYFTPIHGAGRNVKHDGEIGGWQFDKGDKIFMAYASANRDPLVFDDAEDVKLARAPNPHLGWGAGMHRCLGSFLARIMFQVMMEEVLVRIPDYRIVENGVKSYPRVGLVNGLIHVPATFTPGRRSDVIL